MGDLFFAYIFWNLLVTLERICLKCSANKKCSKTNALCFLSFPTSFFTGQPTCFFGWLNFGQMMITFRTSPEVVTGSPQFSSPHGVAEPTWWYRQFGFSPSSYQHCRPDCFGSVLGERHKCLQKKKPDTNRQHNCSPWTRVCPAPPHWVKIEIILRSIASDCNLQPGCPTLLRAVWAKKGQSGCIHFGENRSPCSWKTCSSFGEIPLWFQLYCTSHTNYGPWIFTNDLLRPESIGNLW